MITMVFQEKSKMLTSSSWDGLLSLLLEANYVKGKTNE